jgi:chemotaxis response regulator CheB
VTGSVIEAVVIGASAGALEALSIVLPALPAGYKRPVIVVVHVPPDKPSVLAELFRQRCNVNVREAEDKEPIKGGTIYFAPRIIISSSRRINPWPYRVTTRFFFLGRRSTSSSRVPLTRMGRPCSAFFLRAPIRTAPMG